MDLEAGAEAVVEVAEEEVAKAGAIAGEVRW